MNPHIPYIGNGPYCYANATAMPLATIGETISPSRIEVLTGVGLGAFWLEDAKLIFFSHLGTAPDIGISTALELLGFQYTEKSSQEPELVPFEALRSDLAKSPAILGPLDMGYLSHNPNHEYLAGADHFVLAYAMENSGENLLKGDDSPRIWRCGQAKPHIRGWRTVVHHEQPTIPC